MSLSLRMQELVRLAVLNIIIVDSVRLNKISDNSGSNIICPEFPE